MGTRGKQVVVGAVGLAATLAMLWLGLWQLQVFQAREHSSAQERAAQPAVPLLGLVNADGSVGDVYGRTVTVSGSYLPSQQKLVVGSDGTVRVLQGLLLADGRVLPVVRGTIGSPDSPVPAAPTGVVSQTGVFLASEAGTTHQVPEGTLGSVRLQLLVQEWPQQVLPGFLNLAAGDASAQGLDGAEPVLPSGEGSLQNAGYALQWWVFAAFAAFMTHRFVRSLGRGDAVATLAQEEAE